MLEITGTVSARNMQAQLLDSMDLERERGITIKAQAVRMSLDYDGREYEVNLIDTPGHVDFSYEVSRSLAACEGALLVVDASQGIQAQTLANVYLAMEHDLTIIPVVNKIDLPAAEPGRVIEELSTAFGFQEDEVLRVSAKDGSGVRELLEAVIERVPPPLADAEKPLRALVFDSKYDSYKGVMAYVRVIDGQVTSADRVMMMATGTQSDLLEVGVFKPTMTKVSHLAAGRSWVSRDGPEERRPVQSGRYDNPCPWRGGGGAARLRGAEADGVRGAVSLGRQRVPRSARGARTFADERRGAGVRA